jgi:osmoprotectant transport system permease protein
VLEGAIPAALLALAVDGVFALVARLIVPRGLRAGQGAGRSRGDSAPR